jgi:hypothetical protein
MSRCMPQNKQQRCNADGAKAGRVTFDGVAYCYGLKQVRCLTARSALYLPCTNITFYKIRFHLVDRCLVL